MNIKNFYIIFSQKKLFYFLSIFLLIFSFFFNYQKAEAISRYVDNIDIVFTPKIPGANEKVNVSLNSYSFNINSVKVSVFLNDEVYIDKKIGLKNFSFQTKNFNEKVDIKIVIEKQNGNIIEEFFSIIPAEVDLIYEVKNSHRPEGYKGKSEVLSNSELSVYAFPSLQDNAGNFILKENLVYKWFLDFKVDLDNSGYGKYFYDIKNIRAFPRGTRISVEVSSLDGKKIATNYISFNPRETTAEFYILEPGFPFSFKNIIQEEISVEGLDADILAVPYFIDKNFENLEYDWRINNAFFFHGKDQDKNSIFLANDAKNFLEKVSISLEIINNKNILQSLDKTNFSINFKQISGEDDQDFFTDGSVNIDQEEDSFFNPF